MSHPPTSSGKKKDDGFTARGRFPYVARERILSDPNFSQKGRKEERID